MSDKMAVHYSSVTPEWETPQDFFDRLNVIHNFDLDVCATPENAKCKLYFTASEDGLAQEWRGSCWMNPPYGRGIGAWVKKAFESSLDDGVKVVCLLPSRTCTKWFHDYCMKGEIEFIRGRLRFSNAKKLAPFPCMIVIFRGKQS